MKKLLLCIPFLSFSTPSHSIQIAQLTPSVDTLALSIKNPRQNPALTGKSRQIFIQNSSDVTATNISVSTTGLPSGTQISSTCTGQLNSGRACSITISPGAHATSDCAAGTQPTAGVVTVTADGGVTTEVRIYVLAYACQYQGGFIYSIDDTTPDTGSVGGNVVSLIDQIAPRSKMSGMVIQTWAAHAGVCSLKMNGYSDWRLPSICQMDAVYNDYKGCPSGAQSMSSSLSILTGSPKHPCILGHHCLTGPYWSSTEEHVPSLDAIDTAWGVNFDSEYGSNQVLARKDYQFGIRCSRSLIP